MNGEEIPADWCEGYESGGVFITPINEAACAPGTQEKVDEAIEAIKSGKLHVFDTTTFTVKGKSLEDLVLEKDESVKDVADLIADNYFHESDVAGGHISAPAFAFTDVDGITAITQ
jgi:basic membrane protein A